MKDGESESNVRFGVTPFFDVPKIEHRRFSAFPCNKKPFQVFNFDYEFRFRFRVFTTGFDFEFQIRVSNFEFSCLVLMYWPFGPVWS